MANQIVRRMKQLSKISLINLRNKTVCLSGDMFKWSTKIKPCQDIIIFWLLLGYPSYFCKILHIFLNNSEDRNSTNLEKSLLSALACIENVLWLHRLPGCVLYRISLWFVGTCSEQFLTSATFFWRCLSLKYNFLKIANNALASLQSVCSA